MALEREYRERDEHGLTGPVVMRNEEVIVEENCSETLPLNPVELRGDPRRFLVGFIFCFISLSNAMQWITFSAVIEETRRYFHMTAIQVNYLATTYVIAYVVAVFLSCKLYEVTGLKIGVVVSALTNTIGASIKLIALYFWPNMILLFVAQVFNSVTEILTIATPPLIANRWFPVRERMVANTVLSSALNFGCGIGVLVPTFFVTPDKQEQRHFGNLFWFQFAICATMFLMSIFFIPLRPRYMASHAAARQQRNEEKRLQAVRGVLHHNHTPQNPSTHAEPNLPVGCDDGDVEVQPMNVFSTLMDALRAVRRNPSFAFLMIASAAELGLIWAVATVLPQCLSPFLVTEVESGWISFLNLVLGTIVAPFLMTFVLRHREYKTVLVFIAMILTVNMSILTLCLAYGPSPLENRIFHLVVTFVLWGGVAGLCQNFLMPLLFEFVVEITFPLAESTGAPMLTWAACLSNLILAVVFGEVLGNNPTREDAINVFVGATVVCFIGGLSLLMVYPYNRRQEYEAFMCKREEALQTTLQLQRRPEGE